MPAPLSSPALPPRELEKAGWLRLSPLLDELLDLPEGARRARLRALRAQDAVLADGLSDLLDRLGPPDSLPAFEPEPPAQGGRAAVLAAPPGATPLAAWCEARQLGVAARLRLLLPILADVAGGHARQQVHGRLAVSAIAVGADGMPLLLDRGGLDGSGAPLAASAADGRALHAAPEQWLGQAASPASDVYALGVLLYGLLGGGHPTAEPGGLPLALPRTLLDTVPLRLSEAVLRRGGADAPRQARQLRGGLDGIVARALSKEPAARQPDAAALASALRDWLEPEPLVARAAGTPWRLARYLGRQLRKVAR